MEILIPCLIVTAIGLIVGVGLSLAAKFMAVPTDERQEKIRECLPGANCGACGFSGCDGYAQAIAEGTAEPDRCSAGGASTAAALAQVLGVSVESEEKVAVIACSGTREKTAIKFSYNGAMQCAAANLVQGGPLSCEYGCIGFGDCMRACPFGAISESDGKMVVCKDICVGCGACVAACPKGIISLIPKNAETVVMCKNKSKGAQVVKNCSVSCIACKLCEKNCPNSAITVVDNLAVIDYSLCTNCGTCKTVCKRGVIK